LWLYLFFHPFPPKIDRRLHEAVGEVLAEEAANLLEPGARLIVLARDPHPFKVPAAQAQVDGFMRALKKSGRSILSLRSFKVDPLRVVSVPRGDFFDLLRQGRENDVLVSFLGPPLLSPDQLAKLGQKRARVLAVCSGAMPMQVDLKKLFHEKLLAVAIVHRQEAPAKAPPGPSRVAFEQMFMVITASNLSELPAVASAAH
jgi:hypothetical protein